MIWKLQYFDSCTLCTCQHECWGFLHGLKHWNHTCFHFTAKYALLVFQTNKSIDDFIHSVINTSSRFPLTYFGVLLTHANSSVANPRALAISHNRMRTFSWRAQHDTFSLSEHIENRRELSISGLERRGCFCLLMLEFTSIIKNNPKHCGEMLERKKIHASSTPISCVLSVVKCSYVK